MMNRNNLLKRWVLSSRISRRIYPGYGSTFVSMPVGGPRCPCSVEDLPPVTAPLVSLQVAKSGEFAASTTDPSDGNGVSSNQAILVRGQGAYTLLVDKTGSGAENYRVVAECHLGAGIFNPGILLPIPARSGRPVRRRASREIR